MGSSGKKKTTMAKLMRESKLRERRLDKAARKDARKRGVGAYAPDVPEETLTGEPGETLAGTPDLGAVTVPLADA
jgi:hypothetical protein